jgi:hypothetical protein
MPDFKSQAVKIAALLPRLLLAPAVRPNRLPLGRCACGDITVLWCTRHGQPLKPASPNSALDPG